MNKTPRYFTIMCSEELRKYRAEGCFLLVLQVPWKMMLEHEKQAQNNHSQSIERLHQRGGLSASEAVAVLQDRKFTPMPSAQAHIELFKLSRDWVQKRDQAITESLQKEIENEQETGN